MKRTWRDAACEVAWNIVQKYVEYSVIGFLPRIFLAEGKGVLLCFPEELVEHKGRFVAIANSEFLAFRAAFMKWLDENEVKN